MANRKIGLGQRVAEFLREEYPQGERVNRIQRDFDVSRGTVNLSLSGHTPTNRYIEEMAAKWQGRFIRYVFQDYTDDPVTLTVLKNADDYDFKTPAVLDDRHEATEPSWVTAWREHLANNAYDVGDRVGRNVTWVFTGVRQWVGSFFSQKS